MYHNSHELLEREFHVIALLPSSQRSLMNARRSHKTSEHEAIRNVVIGQCQRQGLDVSRLERLNVCFNVKTLLCLNR